MSLATRVLTLFDRLSPPSTVRAHCDIPCGIYDPELPRIEAESAYKAIEKYHDSDDEVFRQRCIQIKEQRVDIAKHHLSILWSDYFKPEHLDQVPDVHETFWNVLKQCTTVKGSVDLEDARKLLDMIDEVEQMWRKTGGPDTSRMRRPT
jgi:nickel superoxide dismutase